MQVSAPAKINLSLRLLGRRDDGFHEIETFISPISLADELTIERKEQGEGIDFRCDDASIPPGADNLVVRAASTFFETTKLKPAVTIELRKKIPHGAGLGGGSSDAASTLLALNTLFRTNLPRAALAQLGSTIGSDIPFFIFESAAMCHGRGELVTPEHLSETFSLLLVKPDFAVPTDWAYSRWQESHEIPGISYEPQELRGHRFLNDLERPVFEKFVFLAEIKTWLLEQPEVGVALMSGSGSTVFAVLDDPGSANALAERVQRELDPKLWACACQTI
jgi:4-diphosphocytidyl-2-C-methyl-D-erythritol kinase